MTTARMLRTRRSASRLVSSSIWRTSRARVVADLVLELLEQQLLGLRRRDARRRARARARGARAPPSASLRAARRTLPRARRARRSRASSASSRDARRSSRRPISWRRASASSTSASAAGGSLAGARAPGASAAPGRRRRAQGPASPAAAPRPPGRPQARPPRSRFPLSVSSLRTPPCRARRDPMLPMFERRQIGSGPEPGARGSA